MSVCAWEYRSEELGIREDDLSYWNELGAAGWELTAVARWYAYFKRPKSDDVVRVKNLRTGIS